MDYIKLLLSKKWLIFWLMLFGAVVAFDISVIQEPQYKATSRILVIQKQTQGQDIYAVSKSAQYISRILQEAVYTDTFYNQVLSSTDQISEQDFPQTPKERRKAWGKSVAVNILEDLGVMEISVYNPQPDKIEAINEAIINVLVNYHQFYHGVNDSVEVKILDKPLASATPVSPNIWLNTLIGALAGLVSSMLIILNKRPKEISFGSRNEFSAPKGGF